MKDGPSVKKTVELQVIDGCPDWTHSSTSIMTPWKDENLDMVTSACMLAGHSHINPIEHLWSPCSKFLDGVSLSVCMLA